MHPCSGEEVEKEACFILGLLAIKQEHQHAIADQVTRVPAGAPCMRAKREAEPVAPRHPLYPLLAPTYTCRLCIHV